MVWLRGGLFILLLVFVSVSVLGCWLLVVWVVISVEFYSLC